MSKQNRWSKIIDLCQEKESVTINELVTYLNASPATIRRDLQEMEDLRMLTRFHGGAKLSRASFNEPAMLIKSELNAHEKRQIGYFAAKKIKDNQAEYAIKGLLIKNNIKKYGYPNWYGWRRDNWGTKWNAYNFEKGELTNQIIFYTANTTPLKVYRKLTQLFPDVTFTFEWADEDKGYNAGYAVVKDNDLINYHIYNDYEEDSINYASNLWNSIR